MRVAEIAADLKAEQGTLDDIVADLDDEQWELPTPSPGWSVSDQIGHLTYFDGTATLAITAPERFADSITQLLTAKASGDHGMDELTLGAFRTLEVSERLAAWRANRRALADAAATLAEDARVPWYGPSMSARSFLTARLMETWAHGQDVVDAVGADRPATDRLRHIAQLGYITRDWSYVNAGLDAPEGRIRLELTSPSGDLWTWGPEPGTGTDGPIDTVSGDAVDFCLVVTQRRHLDDTGLSAGAVGRDWLLRAQAFAGPPTTGPEPRS